MTNDRFWVRLSQPLLDIALFVGAFGLAFVIRFEGIPEPEHLRRLVFLFPYVALARLISFALFSIYAIDWKYISIIDVLSILKATLPVTVLLTLIRVVVPETWGIIRLSFGVIALELLLVLGATLGVRMTRRLAIELFERKKFQNVSRRLPSRTLLVGAGNAGNVTLKELKQRTDLGIEVVGFVDDNVKKVGRIIQGVPVLGTTGELREIVKKYDIDEAIISIANASSKAIRRIVEACEAVDLKVKIVPGLFEILDGRIQLTKIRDINIDDLLGRSVVHFREHLARVTQQYRQKRILVTGAGGSIGSELCRQLSILDPQALIIVDKDENSVYEVERSLSPVYNGQRLKPVIADIRNLSRMRHLFEKYRPEIVFHAAAHKHVPLMEENVSEAILNNILGTKQMAELARDFGVLSFIFISTDKAVRPTSVMGATKKVGEIIVQEIAAGSPTRFSCVRFGNVLGSRGSVVPLFQKQIAEGGPITLTHPEVKRYFMSISEAVQLIIQAGTLGNKGEICVLNMGEPIRILDLAKDMIKLSGFQEEDFEFRYIGLRKGEKLNEEILIDEEKIQMTQFMKIFIAPPIEVDQPKFFTLLERLLKAAEESRDDDVIATLKEMNIGYVHSPQG